MNDKSKQAHKLLEMLTEAFPDALPVNDDTRAKMRERGLVTNRLAAYIWDIRTHFSIDVESVRAGRKVVGYRLGAKRSYSPLSSQAVATIMGVSTDAVNALASSNVDAARANEGIVSSDT